jgi:hypothetical protein
MMIPSQLDSAANTWFNGLNSELGLTGFRLKTAAAYMITRMGTLDRDWHLELGAVTVHRRASDSLGPEDPWRHGTVAGAAGRATRMPR